MEIVEFNRINMENKGGNDDSSVSSLLVDHFSYCEGNHMKCTECGKQYHRHASFKCHLLMHHIDNVITCDNCSAEFTREDELESHLKSCCHVTAADAHLEISNYPCKQCDATFKRPLDLAEHRITHKKIKESLHMKRKKRIVQQSDMEKRFSCEFCSKSFSKQSSLLRHMVIHTGERSYKCKVCQKAFNHPGALMFHEAKHMPNKPHVCQLCGAGFSQRGNLRTHVKRVHPVNGAEGRPACPLCSCVFRSLQALNTHFSKRHVAPDDSDDAIAIARPINSDLPDEQLFDTGSNNETAGKSLNEKHHQSSQDTTNIVDSVTQEQQQAVPSSKILNSKDGKRIILSQDRSKGVVRIFINNSNNANEDRNQSNISEKYVNAPVSVDGTNDANTGTAKTDKIPQKPESTASAPAAASRIRSSRKPRKNGNGYEKNRRPRQQPGDGFSGSNLRGVRIVYKHGRYYWICPYCNRETVRSSDLVRHVRVHTGDKPYKCNICPKSYALKATRDHHMRTHLNLKTARCYVCFKELATSTTLKAHLRLHHYNASFKCSRCPKLFRTKQRYETHLAKMHANQCVVEETEQQISIMDKSIVEPDLPEPLLETDQGIVQLIKKGTEYDPRTHNELDEYGNPMRRHKCRFCPLRFKNKAHWRVHERSHTGEKPYECRKCQARYKTIDALKDHSARVHSHVTRNFPCPSCSKFFSTKRALARHRFVHVDSRPFLCPFCPKRFRRGVLCRKHIKRHKFVEKYDANAENPFLTQSENENFIDQLPIAASTTAFTVQSAPSTMPPPVLMNNESIGILNVKAPTADQPYLTIDYGSSDNIVGNQSNPAVYVEHIQQSDHVISKHDRHVINNHMISMAQHVPPPISHQHQQQQYGGQQAMIEYAWNERTIGQVSSSIDAHEIDASCLDQFSSSTMASVFSPTSLQTFMDELEFGTSHVTISAASTNSDGSGGTTNHFKQQQDIVNHNSQSISIDLDEPQHLPITAPSIASCSNTVFIGESFMCAMCGATFADSSSAENHYLIHNSKPTNQHRATESAENLPGHLISSFSTPETPHDKQKASNFSKLLTSSDNDFHLTLLDQRHLIRDDDVSSKSIENFDGVFQHSSFAYNNDSPHLQQHKEMLQRYPASSSNAGVGNELSETAISLQQRQLVIARNEEDESDWNTGSTFNSGATISRLNLDQCGKAYLNVNKNGGASTITSTNSTNEHTCQYCLRKFRKPSDLSRHERCHTGEKPFTCSKCGKSFRVKSTLTVHERTHSPGSTIFTHRCEVCSKDFASKGSLKIHYRVHTDETPFQCMVCRQKFRSSSHLRSHMTAHHSDPSADVRDDGTTTDQNLRILADTETDLNHHPSCNDISRINDNEVINHNVQNQDRRISLLCPAKIALKIYQEDDSTLNVTVGFVDSSADQHSLVHALILDVAFLRELATKNLTLSLPVNLNMNTTTTLSSEITESASTSLAANDSASTSRVGQQTITLTINPADILRNLLDDAAASANYGGDNGSSTTNNSRYVTNSANIRNDESSTTADSIFMIECELCDKKFQNSFQSRRHFASKEHKNAFYISNLPYDHDIRASTISSRSSTTSPVPRYPCIYCPKIFPTSFRLKRHVTLHTGAKPFYCDYCGLCFTEKDSVKEHIADLHLLEHPFCCCACGLNFSSRSNVEKHIRKFHGPKNVHNRPHKPPQQSQLQQEVPDRTGDHSETVHTFI